jgi:hypothetical protein
MKKIMTVLLICLLGGCATTQTDFTKFKSANVRSILIVPAVNRSVDVSAPDLLLSTISIPVAEQGYYVFPVNMTKRVLEDDGLSDSDLVHNAPTEKLCSLFGADAVLYISIEQWDAKYLLFTTQVTVGLNYKIKDGKTGDILWEHKETMVYTPPSSGSLLADAINAAVTKAAPNYIPLAQKANLQAISSYPGPGIPLGPYAEAIEEKKKPSENRVSGPELLNQ